MCFAAVPLRFKLFFLDARDHGERTPSCGPGESSSSSQVTHSVLPWMQVVGLTSSVLREIMNIRVLFRAQDE